MNNLGNRFDIELGSRDLVIVRCASSSKDSGRYYVTADLLEKRVSCTCMGNTHHGHCKHAEAVKTLLGWELCQDEQTPLRVPTDKPCAVEEDAPGSYTNVTTDACNATLVDTALAGKMGKVWLCGLARGHAGDHEARAEGKRMRRWENTQEVRT